jgi:hypothetical protein
MYRIRWKIIKKSDLFKLMNGARRRSDGMIDSTAWAWLGLGKFPNRGLESGFRKKREGQ